MFLIGSRAAAHWVNYKFYRPVKDWDVVGTRDEFDAFMLKMDGKVDSCYPSSGLKMQLKMKNGDRIEFEFIQPGNSNELLEKVMTGHPYGIYYYDNDVPLRVAPFLVLYLIKRSHIYWNVHWKKNIEDLHWLKNKCQNSVMENIDRTFYTRRLIESSQKFGKIFLMSSFGR